MLHIKSFSYLYFGLIFGSFLLLEGCGSGALQVTPNASSLTGATLSSPGETLVWSDEFASSAAQSAPDPQNWAYRTSPAQTGELAVYCGPNTTSMACNPNQPNSFVGSDGYLHIQARNAGNGQYTSAMLWTQALQSFKYGRIESRMKLPSASGFWPAFWMLGNNFGSVQWPMCGEIDVMENLSKSPTMVWGTIHGQGFSDGLTQGYNLPAGESTMTDFHTYGIIWSPQKISLYVDDPANIYSTFTPDSLPAGATWPFDSQQFFLVLNLSVWSPAVADQQELLVDYVRVWREPEKN